MLDLCFAFREEVSSRLRSERCQEEGFPSLCWSIVLRSLSAATLEILPDKWRILEIRAGGQDALAIVLDYGSAPALLTHPLNDGLLIEVCDRLRTLLSISHLIVRGCDDLSLTYWSQINDAWTNHPIEDFEDL